MRLSVRGGSRCSLRTLEFLEPSTNERGLCFLEPSLSFRLQPNKYLNSILLN